MLAGCSGGPGLAAPPTASATPGRVQAPGAAAVVGPIAPPDADLRRYLLDCQQASTGMPGLASIGELEGLRTLDGDARDRHFLNLMRAHHQGALPMARFAAEQAQLPAVRELAMRVVLEQAREIDRIELMLQALPAAAPAEGR